MPTNSTSSGESSDGPVYFMDVFDEWFAFFKHEWAINTYRKYKSVGNVIREYERRHDIRLLIPIEKRQYVRFVQYLQGVRRCNVNSVARYSKVMRTVANYYDENAKTAFLRTAEKAPPVVSLTREELTRWVDLPVDNWLIKARDLMTLQSMTGMRYSDTQQQLLKLVDGNMLRYVARKTGLTVAVPIRPKLLEVLNSYPGGLIKISNQVANRALKELGRRYDFTRIVNGEQLCRQLSTHVGRKTFITLSLRQGIPMTYVMKMAGITNPGTIRRYDSANEDYLIEAMSRWAI